MSLKDLRPYSLVLMVPLCFASAALAAAHLWRASFALDFLLALVFVDHVAGDASATWTGRKSLLFTAFTVGAGCAVGMAVLGMGLTS